MATYHIISSLSYASYWASVTFVMVQRGTEYTVSLSFYLFFSFLLSFVSVAAKGRESDNQKACMKTHKTSPPKPEAVLQDRE